MVKKITKGALKKVRKEHKAQVLVKPMKVRCPKTQDMLESAKDIVSTELRRFKNQVKSGEPLKVMEVSAVCRYIESLTKMAKVEMEMDERDDAIAQLSDEDLERMLPAVASVLEDKNGKEEEKGDTKEDEPEAGDGFIDGSS